MARSMAASLSNRQLSACLTMIASSVVTSFAAPSKSLFANARLVRGLRAFPEFHFQLGEILLAHVPLEQHLHRKLAGFCAERHVTCAAAFRQAPLSNARREVFVTVEPFLWRRAPLRILCSRP